MMTDPSAPFRKAALALAILLGLTACGVTFNAQDRTRDVAAIHPISVDRQTLSLTIPVDQTLDGLHREHQLALDALVTVYHRRGHGAITVTAPAGTNRDIDAQQTAADVREALNRAGVDYRDIQGATYRAGGSPETVIVSFSQYVATGPECGAFAGATRARLASELPPNFGCAAQVNLAAMISDPRDLLRPQTASLRDGVSSGTPVEALRESDAIVNEAGFFVFEKE